MHLSQLALDNGHALSSLDRLEQSSLVTTKGVSHKSGNKFGNGLLQNLPIHASNNRHHLLHDFLGQTQGLENQSSVEVRTMDRASNSKLNFGTCKLVPELDPSSVLGAMVGSAQLHEGLVQTLAENWVEETTVEVHATLDPRV